MLVQSNPFAQGSLAPDFTLVDTISDNMISLQDVKGEKGTVIMFICNHCPFVIHVNPEIVRIANEYKSKGVSFIAISSNDVEAYPEDAPDKMSIVAKVLRFPFPYLYDKHQEVARAYDAACTPDFYVFDGDLKLTYRGRLDDSRPGNNIPLSGKDLRSAIDATLLGEVIDPQYPSAGCNIKWKPS